MSTPHGPCQVSLPCSQNFPIESQPTLVSFTDLTTLDACDAASTAAASAPPVEATDADFRWLVDAWG